VFYLLLYSVALRTLSLSPLNKHKGYGIALIKWCFFMATMYVLLVCMFCLCVCFVPVLSLLCYTYIRAYISCHLISSFMKGVKELYLLKLVANVSATSFIKVYNIKWTTIVVFLPFDFNSVHRSTAGHAFHGFLWLCVF